MAAWLSPTWPTGPFAWWSSNAVIPHRLHRQPDVGPADPTTGAVSGSINIKDWDGDPLTYSAVVSPTKGSLIIDSATGAYTYMPTQAARDAAVSNPGLTDTFTIRAIDPYGAYDTTAPVAVAISPTPSTPPLTVTPRPSRWAAIRPGWPSQATASTSPTRAATPSR